MRAACAALSAYRRTKNRVRNGKDKKRLVGIVSACRPVLPGNKSEKEKGHAYKSRRMCAGLLLCDHGGRSSLDFKNQQFPLVTGAFCIGNRTMCQRGVYTSAYPPSRVVCITFSTSSHLKIFRKTVCQSQL